MSTNLVECPTCNALGTIQTERDCLDLSGHHWTSRETTTCPECNGEGYVSELVANCVLTIEVPIRPVNGVSEYEIKMRALRHLAWELDRDLWDEFIGEIDWDIDYES